MYNVKKLQRALKDKGFYTGPIHGTEDASTKEAIIAFKSSVGLRARDYVGPKTLALLFADQQDDILEGEALIKVAQYYLKQKGFYTGKIDGEQGPQTDLALVKFKTSIGYRPRPYLGPLTLAALVDGRIDLDRVKFPKAPATKAKKRWPVWLSLAYSYNGMREIRGARHNPKIIQWWKKLGLPFRDDETPWCAGFVNGVMQEAGFSPPRANRAAARGWDWANHGIKLKGPAVGAVVTFSRKNNPRFGHIGFVIGRDQKGHLMVLGGNQGNAVNVKPFSRNRVVSYRWPKGAPPPSRPIFSRLTLVNSNGKPSTNEQ